MNIGLGLVIAYNWHNRRQVKATSGEKQLLKRCVCIPFEMNSLTLQDARSMMNDFFLVRSAFHTFASTFNCICDKNRRDNRQNTCLTYYSNVSISNKSNYTRWPKGVSRLNSH